MFEYEEFNHCHDDFHHHCHEPHRRENPPFCGDVDTTQMGGIYDVQHMHGHCDPHCGYHIPSVPPLPPTFPSMTEAQQILDIGHKVNELCGTIDGYNKKVEDAYCAIVNSTLCNSAYYKEVWTEYGYIPESGANYKVVHIPFLDRAKQPIYMELELAFDNTTNSGVKEECFSASKRVDADKLIPAQNVGDSFTGSVTWKGAPIFTQTGDSYTFGVTQSGFFRSYKNATADILKSDKIRNSCGARGILVYNKILATENFPEDASEMKARVAVGQNYDTKERFIIVVDGGETTGCTSEQLANLFIKYECMVALELASATSVYGMDRGSMMFAPAVASEDDTPSVPVSNAFWYITKRRHFHNEYVKDVADLIQTVGEEIWRRTILNEQTDYVKERVVELAKELKEEEEARKNGDSTLDEKYAAEVERLDNECARIEKESKERDIALQTVIDNEAKIRESNDVKKVAYVDDGDKRTYSLYRNDDTKIAENIEVYEYNKLVATLQTLGEVAENLKTEVAERKKADDNLQAQITKEIADRTNSATELQSQITAEVTARKAKDTELETAIKAEETARIAGDAAIKQEIEADIQSLIDAEKVARENGDKELAESIRLLKNDYEDFKTNTTADLTQINTQLDTIVVDITNIKTVLDTHTTQMASINATITALQTTISVMETSLENMKQTVSALQTSWSEYKEVIDKALDEIKTIIKNLDDTYVRLDSVMTDSELDEAIAIFS